MDARHVYAADWLLVRRNCPTFPRYAAVDEYAKFGPVFHEKLTEYLQYGRLISFGVPYSTLFIPNTTAG
jgi:hypothetical protein